MLPTPDDCIHLIRRAVGNSDDSALAPCPFCFGSAVLKPIRDGSVVACRLCFAEGPAEFFGPRDKPGAPDRAIAAWNRRALEPPPVVVGREEIARGVYVASRASVLARGEMWRRLRAEGAPIISTWIDEDGENDTADLDELWVRINREVTGAAALILYVETDDFPLKGAFVEVGMAIGAGVPIFVVAPGVEISGRNQRPFGSWCRHPSVRFCATVDEALAKADAIISLLGGQGDSSSNASHAAPVIAPLRATARTRVTTQILLLPTLCNQKKKSEMNVQAMLDAMLEGSRNTRSNYHLTLAGAISGLEALNRPSARVVFDAGDTPGELKSYRGYYSDLAFEPSRETVTVAEVLVALKAALGATFEGYKGGDFVMGANTPLWVSAYGMCSDRAVIGIRPAGDSVILTTKLTSDE